MSHFRFLVAIGAVACSTAARAPAPASVPADAQNAANQAPGAQPSADVRFILGMIPHHAQALAMTALVPARSRRDDIRLLAQRIERSQKDEIAAMERWLRRRGEAAPSADPHHAHHGAPPPDSQPLMPGMLTHEELMQLETATGAEFDRLFLERMIRHHQGALTMVKELFATPGAAQDPELYRFASDVDADQRAEITRMQTLLRALQ